MLLYVVLVQNKQQFLFREDIHATPDNHHEQAVTSFA